MRRRRTARRSASRAARRKTSIWRCGKSTCGGGCNVSVTVVSRPHYSFYMSDRVSRSWRYWSNRRPAGVSSSSNGGSSHGSCGGGSVRKRGKTIVRR